MKEIWEAACWFLAMILALAGFWYFLVESDKIITFCFLILASQWVAIAKMEDR